MAIKIGTIVNDIFDILSTAAEYLPMPFEDPYAHLRRIRKIPYKTYYDSIHNLQRRGVVKIVSEKGQKFIQLTNKGMLETLLLKAMVEKPGKWDGKWRLFIFDIPEDAKKKRDILRNLLKKNNFYKLQASVFIHPHPFNISAIDYLKESGLMDYIRILRVDHLDDEKTLKRYFNLN